MEHCEMRKLDAGRIALCGQLTRNTVPDVWSKRNDWLADNLDALTFDIEAVEKVDSAGVAMLIQAKKALSARQREMLIVNANDQFKAMLSVSGVDTLLTLSQDAPENSIKNRL